MYTTKYENSLIFSLLVIAILAGSFLYQNKKIEEDFKIQETQIIKKEKENFLELKNELNNLDVLAKSISIYDLNLNKIIYSKNDKEQRPLASLVKTMTVILALENQNFDDIIITKKDLKTEGENGLLLNEKWDKIELAKFTLIFSSNDGANSLARLEDNFLEKMNSKAQEIGMKNTVFLNPTGLDLSKDSSGSIGTAFDANILAIYALKKYPDIFKSTTLSEIKIKSKSGFIHDVTNTNLSINKIPNILFSKTGYTELAGGNLTVIFKNKMNHDLAVTILGSSMNGRFSDIEKIVNVLYNSSYEI